MLAAAPITWGVCELPGWGVELPYRRVLDEMAAAGYKGTELGPHGYFPAEPARLRQELQRRGMSLVGAFCPVTLHDAERAEGSLEEATQLAQLLSNLECRFLVAADAGDEHRREIAGRVGEQDALDTSAWQRFGDGLARLATICQPLGVEVVFHPHAGTYVEAPSEVDALLGVTPADLVGLCLDTGHLVYGGGDPVEVARRHAARVRHVHAKDVRGDELSRVRAEGIDYVTAVGKGIFAPLGEGIVDFPGLIAALQEAGYSGWYVLEQDVRLGPPWPEQDPYENAQRSAAYLRRLLDGAPRRTSAQ
jgi:inosose dehydratase